MKRSKLEAASWLAVVHAYQECNRRYARLLDAFELTIPQFDVLTAIARSAQTTPKAIADELIVTRGNVTGVLRRLQDRGLIETRNNPADARSFFCELTPAGKRLLDDALSAASRFVTAQLAPFSDAELERTQGQMLAMREHLQQLDVDALISQSRHRSNQSAKTGARQG